MSPSYSCSLDEFPRSIAWAPDGRSLVVGLAGGECACAIPGASTAVTRWRAHDRGLQSARWSPAAGPIATGGEDGRVGLWHPTSGAKLADLDAGSPWVESLAWSPDGSVLAAAAGRQVRFWNATGEPLGGSRELPGTVGGIHWRSDPLRLAVVCYGRIEILDPAGFADPEVIPWKAAFVSVAWSPDGRHLAAGTQEGSIVYWQRHTGDGDSPLQMTGYPSKVTQLAWDRASRFLASAGGSVVTLWDVSGAGPAGTTPQELEGHDARVTVLAWQRSGDMLVSAGRDGSVCLWNPRADGKGWILRRKGAGITAAEWSPDGRRLAAADEEGQLMVFS